METMDFEDNNGGIIDSPYALEPTLLIEVIEAFQAETPDNMIRKEDMRLWLNTRFSNADQILFYHGVVDQTRNRVHGIGRKGQAYPFDDEYIAELRVKDALVKSRRVTRNESRELRREKSSSIESDIGSAFLQKYPKLASMYLDNKFPATYLSEMYAMQNMKAAFLRVKPDGEAVFSKYVLAIMQNALTAYRNKELPLLDAYYYINAMYDVAGDSTKTEARRLGDEFFGLTEERDEYRYIAGTGLMQLVAG